MLKKTEAILSDGQVDRRTCEGRGLQKFKATSEPFSVLRIGNYEVRPRYPSDLIAKWYYTRERLNWEILENGLKKKIEISWKDISAIRVEYGGNVELLEIELSKPPHFYCETEVRPKKHTSWKPSYDFTDCQACTYRRHHLEFPQGTLERNMEPLFFLDSPLRELSRRPFPSSESPFFEGYLTEATQSAPPLINSELIQLRHHLHHQLPPSHSSVPARLVNDELMILIQEYQRRLANHQMPFFDNSPSSQVSDYAYAPPPSLPRNRTIFNGQFMGHSLEEQIVAPSSYNSDKVTMGTGHGHQGYDHNSNPSNKMMASKEPSYMSADMNVAHHIYTWNNKGIFNQDMGHHSGLVSSSNTPVIDVPSSSCYYPITNYYAGQGSHEGYNSNNEPCMNDTNPHHAHAHDGPIYPELESNHDGGLQNSRFLG
ncbi:uncharacterized protein LOC130137598 [Syzygium oleosum]|uniref:uncharacterized protein LOC130137598 n=1 Tax=Syzygium oleosum TaxID=219896 RepID=UPI0024BBA6B2|nr:uncharacterized protein LOC130137598 [Syzygium oleosum]